MRSGIVEKGYDETHHFRFRKSIEYLQSTGVAYKNILECGEPSLFTTMLKDAYPEAKITNSEGDLRSEKWVKKLHGETFDLIIATEILEHLKDRDIYEENDYEKMSTWQYTGVKSFLNISKHLSNNDTVFFFTTPNVNCYKSIEHLLGGTHPFMYQPHVREMSLTEIIPLLNDCGYKVIRKDIIDVWRGHGVKDWFKKEVDSLTSKLLNGSKVERGDNIFLICKTK